MKKIGITIVSILVLGVAIFGGWSYITAPGAVDMQEVTGVTEDLTTIYTSDYQDDKYEQIQLLKEAGHTLKNPLAVPNPYGTYTTGLYVYFTTWMDAEIEYTVETTGYESFQRTLHNNGAENFSRTHEYLLTGIIADETNVITLVAKNKMGLTIGSCTFEYDAPALRNEYGNTMLSVSRGGSKEELTDGLYVLFGNNDISMEEGIPVFTAICDNNGVIRGEMPVINFRAHRFIFDEAGMYYSVSRNLMVRMDATGYLNQLYSTGTYNLHHDYCFDKDGNLIILATDTTGDTVQDKILIMNPDNGETLYTLDLEKNFSEYVKTLEMPEDDTLDWLHINSMELVGEDSLLLSSRETSTIIRLDNIYEEPEVAYMIGSDNFWEGTPYEELLLEKEGDFILQGGQHALNYIEDESLEDGQYYLSFFNNNNTYSESRPDYDWDKDSNYADTGEGDDSRGNDSYYYKYLVDENAKTVSLVQSIPVEYSGYVSSVQEYKDHIIIASGASFRTYEFEQDGSLLQEMQYQGDTWIYRTFKYDFTNFWYQ